MMSSIVVSQTDVNTLDLRLLYKRKLLGIKYKFRKARVARDAVHGAETSHPYKAADGVSDHSDD